MTALPAPTTLTVKYWVAPLSICREEKGNVCLLVDVLDKTCVLMLPVPYWFREKTWKRYTFDGGQETSSTNGARGLSYKKVKVEERDMWDYVDAVVLDRVAKMLKRRKLAGFNLILAKRKSPKQCSST
jgi:hypothetical protein